VSSPERPARSRSPGVGRLLGLRRGGAAPQETRSGEPLRPLTIPNAVGYLRIALLVAFLAIALPSNDGRVTVATVCFAIACSADYLDGLLARTTGQYSRLGRLMDPVIDRLLAVGGGIVAWKFELLPRTALAILLAREAGMVILGAIALRTRLDLDVNWMGRTSVWLTMSGLGLALIADVGLAKTLLYAGIAGSLVATALYIGEGVRRLAARPRPSGS
jgi:cardiolipin synthase